jgi:hypothetical protein
MPAAEVREHVVRRIERELDEDRHWDLKIASTLSYAGAVLRQLVYVALCVPFAIFAFAGLTWATNPAGFAHLVHQILTANETDFRAAVDAVVWTAIGFSGLVLVTWRAFGGGTRSRNHYNEAWYGDSPCCAHSPARRVHVAPFGPRRCQDSASLGVRV